MKRKVIVTADGSSTIQIEEWDEQYHSVHGAIQEANHVYISKGLLALELEQFKTESLSILEIGFGTGLNALLTLLKSETLKRSMTYVGVEAYPISTEELKSLNYGSQLVNDGSGYFERLHTSLWEVPNHITDYFTLIKQQKRFETIKDQNRFHLVYFDAFGARVQPELWTESIFKIMFEAMIPGGILVTYAAKGSVRRAMQSVGFVVERLDGPPGKREMLKAIKPSL